MGQSHQVAVEATQSQVTVTIDNSKIYRLRKISILLNFIETRLQWEKVKLFCAYSNLSMSFFQKLLIVLSIAESTEAVEKL